MFLYIYSLQRIHFIDPLQHFRNILGRKTPYKKETKFSKTRAIFLYNVPFLFECMPTSTFNPKQSSNKLDY